MPRRYDASPLPPATRLDNGWLSAFGRISRVGVFEYRQADGTIRRELRPPDEVQAPPALASFAMVPVTLGHPPEGLLNAETTRERAVGNLGDSVRADGDFVVANLLVTDGKAVTAAGEGQYQLSCGYSCDVDESPGVWRGERYDAVQRNIRGNHVALVGAGRAGPEVRIRLDAGDAVCVMSTPGQSEKLSTEGLPTMRKIKIDGVEYEVSEQVAQAYERAQKLRADAADAEGKAAADAQARATKAEARADAADVKIAELTKRLAVAEDPKAIAERVAERVALESKARELGAEFKADAADDEIRRAVIARVSPAIKLDGKDPLYVRAAFDLAVEGAIKPEPAKPATERLDAVEDSGFREDGTAEIGTYEKAREAHKQRMANMWRKPEAAK